MRLTHLQLRNSKVLLKNYSDLKTNFRHLQLYFRMLSVYCIPTTRKIQQLPSHKTTEEKPPSEVVNFNRPSRLSFVS